MNTRSLFNIVLLSLLLPALVGCGPTRTKSAEELQVEERVSKWIAEGKDLETCSSGGSALYHAASAGAPGAVKMLLDKGAKVDAVGRNGKSSLYYSATKLGRQYVEVTQVLLSGGADPNQELKVEGEKTTPLFKAAGSPQSKHLELMLANGGKTDTKGSVGGNFYLNDGTPLHNAALHGMYKNVEMLLAAGASKTSTDSKGRTPAQVIEKTDGSYKKTLKGLADQSAGEGNCDYEKALALLK